MAIDRLQELQEKRMKIAKQIQDLAKRQDEWTDEDRQNWDTLNSEYDETVAAIEAEQDAATRQARLDKIAQDDERTQWNRRTEVGEQRANRRGEVTEEHRALALQAWLRRGQGRELSNRHVEACELLNFRTDARELPAVFQSPGDNIRGHQMWTRQGKTLPSQYEARAMSVGTNADGGFTVPEGFLAELERQMLYYGGPRQVARILTTMTGNDLPMPTVNDTSNTGALLAENTTIGSSVDPTFAQVTFKAYKYSSTPILCSAELLEDSAFVLGEVLASLLGERLGRITATHFTTGDNSGKPQGLTTGASAGVTAAGAAAITSDELIDLVHSLDPSYRMMPSVGFMLHDSTLKAVRKLKDGDSQYLWQPGLQAGTPDEILGFPYTINQNMPELATGNITVLFGAFEKYVIRNVAQTRFYRLEERYRDLDQTGFVSFERCDGRYIQTAAIKKLTQA